MIQIAICDDEQEFLSKVRNCLIALEQQIEQEFLIQEFTDGQELCKRVLEDEKRYDIYILDIDMPKLSGLDLAEKIRIKDTEGLLLFLTAHDEYVFRSFECNPFRYIRKWRMEQEFTKAIDEAVKRVESNSKEKIIVQTEDGQCILTVQEIQYLTIERRKIVLTDKFGKKYWCKKTMKNMMSELSKISKDFCQVHSGCAVNMRYVKMIKKSEIFMVDGMCIPVSRNRYQDILDGLTVYWGRIL